MSVQYKTPKQALKQAYRKLKPTRDEIERFKSNLISLLSDIDEREGEEHAKNLVRDFLRETYYKGLYEINVKNKNDLVIHSDKTSASPVCVIIEAKRPSEKYDFPKHDNLNVKAVRELVLYYLRERIDNSNTDIKSLIATNGYEWFIFDSAGFYKSFYENKALVKEYGLWNSGRKDSSSTNMFYKDIAAKYIEAAKGDLTYTYFNIKDYEQLLRNADRTDDKNLIPLYKVLSPSHLLNLGFPNDSNSLDKNFYFELLHIIGLEEVKDGGKKIIRKKEKPDAGSLLENAINILRSEDRLYKVTNPEFFGNSKDEQYFGVALELCITWINRVLFLKLLEAQLLKYFKGDRDYKFLTYENISNFDELNKLFFQVLAIRHEDRVESVRKKFSKVPYLNSSLFERSGLEDDLIVISNLDNGIELPAYSKTVLRDKDGRKTTGAINTIEYLFGFLDAYDFSSEGSEEIQEERKTLINASVLGLIFEKINGYKDGSFFTPGFITMYMCRETVRRAVIQKFNDRYKKDIKDIGELKNFIGSPYKKEEVKEYNSVINSLKICDPAVGSGHFLVSALNEIIAVKSELGILSGAEGNILSGYSAFVENDELMLYNKAAEDPFEYIPGNRESQKVQELLFHEKQTIIENCLFGVDINHNSVKICRLRLWIELLKNAYYTKGSDYKQLETLPNIDINIKCGNSLVSRFSLDADLSAALRKSKWTITSYRLAVQSYQNAKTKEEKRSLESLINEIKTNFRTEISTNDPKQKRLQSLENELYEKYSSRKLLDIELTDKQKAKEKKDRKKLEDQINKLSAEIKDIKESAIYRNAFEWRFEFPEVLDEKGNYIGFDVIIGNPPYKLLDLDSFTDIERNFYSNCYTVSQYKPDLYHYFLERSFSLVKNGRDVMLIVPSTWMTQKFTEKLRSFILENFTINQVLHFDFLVFDEANVFTEIILLQKIQANKNSLIKFFRYNNNDFEKGNNEQVEFQNTFTSREGSIIDIRSLSIEGKLIQSIYNQNRLLSDVARASLGCQAYNSSKHTKEQIKGRVFHSETKKSDEYLEELAGSDVGRYFHRRVKGQWIKYGNWLHDYRSMDWLTGPRILIREVTGKSPYQIQATYLEETYCNYKTILNVSPKLDFQYSMKLLCGILNSRLISFVFQNNSNKIQADAFPRVSVSDLKNLPIKIPSNEKEKAIANSIESFVSRIIREKKVNIDCETTVYDMEIDKLVYQLYGLTDEEIEIVERG